MNVLESIGYSVELITANVYTVNVPASPIVAGFVPPELNVKEKDEPPLANVPLEPNGLVRVTTLLDTAQLVGLSTEDAVVREQEVVSTRTIDEGKVTLIVDAEGIAWAGYIKSLYVVEA